MKCPNCDYFNMPNATTCGRCQRSLVAQEAAITESFLPPRARDRSARQKLEAGLSPSTRRRLNRSEDTLRDLPNRSRHGWQNQVEQTLIDMGSLRFLARWWLPPLLSIVPGLGQLVERRYLHALGFFGSFVLLLLLFFLMLHNPISNTLLWLIGALAIASIFDAGNVSFPETVPEAHRFRQLRIGILGFILVGGLVFSTFWLLTNSYNLIQLPDADAINSTQFRPGDTLLLSLVEPGAEFRRGEIVGMNVTNNPLRNRWYDEVDTWQYTTIACIGALPGDTVSACGASVCVNGQPLQTGWLPASWQLPSGLPFRVPAGNVWALRLAGANVFQVGEGAMAPRTAEARLITTSTIDSRVVAIFNPPPRRRWLNR